MKKFYIFLLLIIISIFYFCNTENICQLETIHPIVNLQIENDNGNYNISFNSNNTEIGFSGYGFFIYNTENEMLQANDEKLENNTSIANAFCNTTSSSYNSISKIRIGGVLPSSDYISCTGDNTSDGVILLPSLSANKYLVIRAYADKQCNTIDYASECNCTHWSKATYRIID